ncbi:MAG TPA: MBL fold metallo-hydrolase [Vicinamibacterales bacterium]|nr:MBL fold metallo-hydrolase [Vicinamibacterales bacterium]
MNTLSHGLSWVDLQFRGRPQVIATALVQGHGGVAIVDPGPTTCLETLELGLQANGIRWPDVRHILLTHIHLDHAGATGTIVRAHPHIKVLVHERGIKHMVDPTKLIESAARVYRDRMDELWGEFAPVPASNLVSLTGGERIEAGGRTFDVAYTPGHASHHVSYFDDSSGVAFVGDTAGVCINGGYVLPPTPPPDIDVEAWGQSVDRILAWSPATLMLTHFGPVTDVRPHFASLLDNLQTTSGIALALLNGPGTDEERSSAFAEKLRHQIRRQMTESEVATYVVAAAYEHLFSGLARYWRKKEAAT